MDVEFEHLKKYVDEDICKKLVKEAEKGTWLKDLTRDTQHYGWKYDYQTRTIKKLNEDIPDFINDLKLLLKYPDADQVIINKYVPGQGISLHRDANVFHDKVMTLSLGSGCMFKVGDSDIYLNPGDVVILHKPLFHAINPRKSDVVDGVKIPRKTRISITFRKVK